MRLQPLIAGLVLIAGGYALNYYEVLSNNYISFGILGVGVLAFLAGLIMKKY